MAALLIVDDDQVIRDVLVEVFSAEHTCEGTASAEEALTLLESRKFDVAILDISLPGMSGVELLGHIRQRWPETQIIIITGIDSQEYVKNLIKMGASDYLVKPFHLQEVETKLTRAILQQEGWLAALRDSTERALRHARPLPVEVSGGMIERRRAVRHGLQRGARLFFVTALAEVSSVNSAQPSPVVMGYTRDISATGLSLIVPGTQESDAKFYSMRSQLRIELALPTAIIDIKVKPVRFEWLGEQVEKRSYLIGAQIVSMSENDRTQFNDYLAQAVPSQT